MQTFSNIFPQPTLDFCEIVADLCKILLTISVNIYAKNKPILTSFSKILAKTQNIAFLRKLKRHCSFNPTSQGFLLMNVPTCGIRDLKMVPVATCRWAKLAQLPQQESLHLVQPSIRVDLNAFSLLSRSAPILI